MSTEPVDQTIRERGLALYRPPFKFSHGYTLRPPSAAFRSKPHLKRATLIKSTKSTNSKLQTHPKQNNDFKEKPST